MTSIIMSLPNRRLLQIETALANSVISKLDQDSSCKCRIDFLVEGQFPYFHIDNSDYTIDTSDGKDQLHGTLIMLFQRKTKSSSTYKIGNVHMKSSSYKIDTLNFTDIRECEYPRNNKYFQLPDGMESTRGRPARPKAIEIIQGTYSVSMQQCRWFHIYNIPVHKECFRRY